MIANAIEVAVDWNAPMTILETLWIDDMPYRKVYETAVELEGALASALKLEGATILETPEPTVATRPHVAFRFAGDVSGSSIVRFISTQNCYPPFVLKRLSHPVVDDFWNLEFL